MTEGQMRPFQVPEPLSPGCSASQEGTRRKLLLPEENRAQPNWRSVVWPLTCPLLSLGAGACAALLCLGGTV
ncbi:hypothetical protein Cadr_000012126 [Camelus dromedarius]|uniref:Uncharacterized protein n=1 Tax=Camelus dromedarius TaxID=9838 RepID=A0A5N4DRF4_CAMDR|nr:hypothetical protein Cadr_000012126 [Camelus dromedarius]